MCPSTVRDEGKKEEEEKSEMQEQEVRERERSGSGADDVRPFIQDPETKVKGDKNEAALPEILPGRSVTPSLIVS